MSESATSPSLVPVELVDRDGATIVEAPEGALVADVLRDQGYLLDYDCGGRGVCGRCVAPLGRAGNELTPTPTCQTRVERRGLRVDVSALKKRDGGGFFSSENSGGDGIAGGNCATDAELADPLGLAIDLGTTSIEVAIVSLSTGRVLATGTRRNPQAAYGRDVVSRIVAARTRGVATLQRLVCDAIGATAANLAERVGTRLDRVEEIVVAGNTTMEFLLTGRDPSPLGVAPFEVGSRFFEERRTTAFPFESKSLSNARVRVFPVFSAFVGGDVLSGFKYLRARGGFDGTRAKLLLDVGTNGEALLAANGRFYATSTAAGPAFEGCEISQGSLAVPGAIVGIDYDAATWRYVPRTLGGEPASSVCGSGVAAALACALDFGLMSSSGRLRLPDAPELSSAPPEIRTRLCAEGRERSILLSALSELPTTGGVRFTQTDARRAQLAVAAMKAGRRIMLETAGVAESELERIWLAGAFGAALASETARRVGLTPFDVPSSRTRVVGNASLLGAIDALTERFSWSRLVEDVDLVEHVDLVSYPNFDEIFAASARFPEAL